MKKSESENLYEKMETIIDEELSKDKELKQVWNEITSIDDLLKRTLSKEHYKIFDAYMAKESELINLERKKAFSYGYNLSNRLMIDSLK